MNNVSKWIVMCALIFFIGSFVYNFGPQAEEKRKQNEERGADALVIRLLLEGKGLRLRDVIWIVDSPDAEERLQNVAMELNIPYEQVARIQESLFVTLMSNPEWQSLNLEQEIPIDTKGE